MDPMRFFVVTGGPGSGKTTLLEALARAGHPVGPEAGRAVIRAETASGGRALPWIDTALFAARMLEHDTASYRAMLALEAPGPAFFDRGIPDTIGYLGLCGLDVPRELEEAARTCRYAPVVFAAPPWPEIFRNDTERRQDFAEAVRTFDCVTDAYRTLGYQIVTLPKAPVDARVDFLLRRAGIDIGD